MNRFLNAPALKNIMGKILLVFMFYMVANISFSGYTMKWSMLEGSNWGFTALYEETTTRPFVYRRLIFSAARNIDALLTENLRDGLTKSLKECDLTQHFSNVHINPNHYIAYHTVYFMAFGCLFAGLFVLRRIGFEITGSYNTGTLAACCFALLFPLTDSRYFYDFSELLFFALATLFALKGWWQALIILAPIAEYNKESFLFFLIALFPLLAAKTGKKRGGIVIGVAVILSGLVYLYVRHLFAGNSGVTVMYWLPQRFNYMTDYRNWFVTDIQYGMITGYGIFLPHLLLLGWIAKCTWKNFPAAWKYHLILAAALNVPLYLLFCAPDEIRNLSMLYMGFFAILTIFIKGVLLDERSG